MPSTIKAPTSIDVARLAGVSQPTVSRAFDPNSPVSPTTRACVMAAAVELGYMPNVIARSLSTQRTNIVGIIMANLTSSLFYANVLEKFVHNLQEMGKQVLLFKTSLERPVDEILPRVLGYQVDALIIASTTPGSAIIEESMRAGTPVILFNRTAPGTTANAVCCDNVEGGRLAADTLLDASHQQLAYIAGVLMTATNQMREKGFTDRLHERGYTQFQREQADYSYEAGRAAARRLLTRKVRPNAIFCAADIIALGVMDTARYEFGLKIPDDLSIIGFDDIPVAGWPAYNLTTIRQPVEAMIEATLALIENNTEQMPNGLVKLLPGQLIMRGSVKS